MTSNQLHAWHVPVTMTTVELPIRYERPPEDRPDTEDRPDLAIQTQSVYSAPDFETGLRPGLRRLSTVVVHLICNQGVAGSNPAVGTKT